MRKKLIIAALMVAGRAYGYGCDANCDTVGGYDYPCGWDWGVKWCHGQNPVETELCRSQKGTSCQDVFAGIVDRIGRAVAHTPAFSDAARSNGWDKATCNVAGVSLATTTALIVGTPICVAVSAGLAGPACAGAITAAGGTITLIACTQLCADRQLSDCK